MKADRLGWRASLGVRDSFTARESVAYTAVVLLVGAASEGPLPHGWATFVMLVVVALMAHFLYPELWNFGMMKDLFRSAPRAREVLFGVGLILGAYYLGVCIDDRGWVSGQRVMPWAPAFFLLTVWFYRPRGPVDG
ncbi:MAG: hypothetical protein VKQ33_09450 [Candidatus Sericytochromatia bacterium]|nr:hypothetical protein [Candidatus Sericytochromatia bacterium]